MVLAQWSSARLVIKRLWVQIPPGVVLYLSFLPLNYVALNSSLLFLKNQCPAVQLEAKQA